MNTFKKEPIQTSPAAVCGTLWMSTWLIASPSLKQPFPLSWHWAPPSAWDQHISHQVPALPHERSRVELVILWINMAAYEPIWLLIWQSSLFQCCFSSSELERNESCFHASLLPWKILREYIFQNKWWCLLSNMSLGLSDRPWVSQCPTEATFWILLA